MKDSIATVAANIFTIAMGDDLAFFRHTIGEDNVESMAKIIADHAIIAAEVFDAALVEHCGKEEKLS